MLKFLASPNILVLEVQEQEASHLDLWEPTDSEDSDQSDGGQAQPLPPAGDAAGDAHRIHIRG